MPRKFARWFVVCALVFTIGAHWAILQSVAWVGMAVTYSQNATLIEALAKTFDGKHPCKICKVVQEGKKSEKKQEAQKPLNKLDLFCVCFSVTIRGPVFRPVSTDFVGLISALTEAPPKPPPRQIFT